MRDEDRRPPGDQRAQSGEQLGLARLVQPRGRLVEQQQGRVAEQRAGDADPLALPAGEPDALRSELGVVAVREGDDEVVRGGRSRRGLDLVRARIGPVGDVVAHAAGEQHGLLQHDRHLLAEPGERAVAQVASVEQDPPRRRVVEPRDQRAERRLADAGRAHHGDAAAGRDVQRDVAQRVPSLRVGERHVLEREVAVRAAAAVRAGPVLQHLVGAEHLGDPLHPRHRRRRLGHLAREPPQRVVGLAGVGDEHDQLPGGQRAVGDAEHAEDEHGRGADRPDGADEPVEPRLRPRHLDAGRHALLAPPAHAGGLVALGAERLDDRHRRQRLARDRGDPALVRAALARLRAHAPPVDPARRPRAAGWSRPRRARAPGRATAAPRACPWRAAPPGRSGRSTARTGRPSR